MVFAWSNLTDGDPNFTLSQVARLRVSLSPRWARALAWSGVGTLFALRLAAMPVGQAGGDSD
jgi:ACR3 family arsenite efflux pump ArsB